MIKAINISKKYKTTILNNFSFTFLERGMYAIVGDSGSGKTTLLNILSGIDRDYDGEVSYNGLNIHRLSQNDRAKFRLENIGYVFQDFKLLNLLTVADNVLLNIDSASTLSKRVKEKLVAKALEYVGLKGYEKRAVNKLSGGERQRVAIARAIISEPKYLLCDEPTGNLDESNAIKIFEILKKYSESHLVIIVSHDKAKVAKYADVSLFIKDGAITDIQKRDVASYQSPKIHINYRYKHNFSFGFLLKSGLSKIKEKKWRFLFTNIIMSISLLSLGVAVLASTALKTQITNSFSNVVDKNQIIVSKKTSNPNPYNAYIATDETTVNKLAKEYEEYLYGVGASYLTDFNSFFKDRNIAYIDGSKRIMLPSYHALVFADTVWKEEKNVPRFYPRIEHDLALEEIALGFTYVDMVNVCIELKIQRSFEALGAYISSHDVWICLETYNYDWGYEKESYFHLVSVYPSNKPEVYHTNHYFNQHFFEEELQLPTTDEIASEPKVPWTLKKVFTLHCIEIATPLIENVSLNHNYDDIVIERRENFLNDSCIISETCPSNIYFVFTIDKNAVDVSDVIEFKKLAPQIRDYYFSTNAGYMMHSSGMISGFVNNIGFSFDEEKIIYVADYFSKQIEGEMVNFPGVAIGGFSRLNNGVYFSSDLNKLKKGETPNDYNEIVVSTGLLKHLEYTKNPIYEDLYYCMYVSTLENAVINKFKVVGVVEDDRNIIYHYPFFTISFFRDKLGISSFNLIPTSIVLNCYDHNNINLIIESLSKSFKEYNFSSPLSEISKSVDEVMNYVLTISTAFTLVSSLIALLLLMLISYLNNIESENEIKTLRYLGHNNKAIINYTSSFSLVSSFITTGIAIFELLIFQFLIPIFFNNYFHSDNVVSINVPSLLITIVAGIFLPLIISRFVTKLYLRKI